MHGMVPVRRPYAILSTWPGRPLQHVRCEYVAKVIAKLPEDTFGVDLAPRLKAAMATTCGDEPKAVSPYYANKENEIDYRKKERPGSKTHLR